MPDINLFPPEDTTINCNLPDGSKISVDALDLDELVAECYNGKVEMPYKELMELMCNKFAEKYNVSVSRRSMSLLLDLKHKILEDVKKNSYPEQESANSTDSNQDQSGT